MPARIRREGESCRERELIRQAGFAEQNKRKIERAERNVKDESSSVLGRMCAQLSSASQNVPYPEVLCVRKEILHFQPSSLESKIKTLLPGTESEPDPRDKAI